MFAVALDLWMKGDFLEKRERPMSLDLCKTHILHQHLYILGRKTDRSFPYWREIKHIIFLMAHMDVAALYCLVSEGAVASGM